MARKYEKSNQSNDHSESKLQWDCSLVWSPAPNHQLEDGSQNLMKIHYGEKLSDVWSPVANHQLEGTAAVAWQSSSQINFNPFRCGVWRFNLGRGGGRQNEANFYHFTQVPSRPNVIWLQHPIHKFRKSKTKVATFPCNIFRQATVGIPVTRVSNGQGGWADWY